MEGVKVIGHITRPELGCALVTRDGVEMRLLAQGFNHMAPTEKSSDPEN